MARISPTMPEVPSVCPTLALAADMVSGTPPLAPDATTAASAPASVGSPSAVPVPCASPSTTAPADIFHAASSRSFCAEPLGAVRLALRPSCRTADAPRVAPSPPSATTVAPTASLRT